MEWAGQARLLVEWKAGLAPPPNRGQGGLGELGGGGVRRGLISIPRGGPAPFSSAGARSFVVRPSVSPAHHYGPQQHQEDAPQEPPSPATPAAPHDWDAARPGPGAVTRDSDFHHHWRRRY